jgi:hypothetical protein
MAPQAEQDFPPGHPGRADYDPKSPEAQEWARRNVAPLGERDFPVDHAAAADTPGNLNSVSWLAGVDPFNPHREAHTGRTPEQAEGVKALSDAASKAAVESPVLQPLDATVAAAALDAKRKEVGRDLLTPEEYRDVLAKVQAEPRPTPAPAEVSESIDKQHQALQALIDAGYTQGTAMEIISKAGADAVLAQTRQRAK